MAEYWVKADISRGKALQVLKELSTEGSELRTSLQKNRGLAKKRLADLGIEVSDAAFPKQVRLPPVEQVKDFRIQAQALIAKDRKPFAFVILAVVFGAMPLVDGAD
jgi:hypothetical protein